MIKKNWTAVIPAAGKSKRFNYKQSKIFYKYKKKFLIEHSVDKIKKHISKVLIVANHSNKKKLKRLFFKDKNIKIVTQKNKPGMASAIESTFNHIKTKFFCILWADQLGMTSSTIQKVITKHSKNNFCCTFPVYFKKNPYVLILLKKNYFLKGIQKSRETNITKKQGYTDCGFFCCDTSFFKVFLKRHMKLKLIITKKTKEYDFLESLNLICKKKPIKLIKSSNKRDHIGINTLKDLSLLNK